MSFAHFTIPTHDVEGTKSFFAKVMKWVPLVMPQNIDIDAAWLEIAPGQQLHILGIEEFAAPQDEEFGRHYAFFHPANDFDGVIERIKSNGGQLVDPIRETPFRRIFFRDPNGYLFELIDQDAYVVED